MSYPVGDRALAWLPPQDIEDAARKQILNLAGLPIVFHHVAVMPDCHLGKGATVGTVVPTKKAVIPAAVGVDIGCGMVAVRTTLHANDLPDGLDGLRRDIEAAVPLGAGRYNKTLTRSARARVDQLKREAPRDDYHEVDRHWEMEVGTLGSGNHFIELALDQDQRVWAVLHSGSRGIGNRLAERYIRQAKEESRRRGERLPDPDLAWLVEGTPAFDAYIADLTWAQSFARMNRDEMMDRVMAQLARHVRGDASAAAALEVERINCHHNFTQKEVHFGEEVWITRKGAIEMQAGQRGVIPGSMGTRSYIVTGRGNVESYASAPHGAGRRFSRGEARRRFSMADFEAAMKGIECRHSPELIDELPGAYKDIDAVIANSEDLIEVDQVLGQVLSVKGD
jgi:tRNA-splicing ligase RtcB (3'-phosphate/5'-hydroxy nucleic acid ligase)